MNRLGNLTVGLFVAVGFVVCFLIPPFQVPDEPSHWASAVVWAKGGGLTSEVCSEALGLSDHFEVGRVAAQSDAPFPRERFKRWGEIKPACSKVQVVYSNLFTYPAVLLLSPFFSSLFRPGFAAIRFFYLSRILSGLLIAWMLWCYFERAVSAYGRLPTGSAFLAVFALSPILAQQSFSVTADGIVNASVLALATVFVGWPKPDKRSLLLLLVFGLVACPSKPVLCPLFFFAACALIFRSWSSATGPGGFWKTASTRWAVLICLGVTVSGLIGFLIFQSNGGLMSHHPGIAGVDPMAQLQGVIAHPFEFIQALMRSHRGYFSAGAWTGYLGWMDTEPLPRLPFLWGALFVLAVSMEVRSFVLWYRSRSGRISSYALAYGAALVTGALLTLLAIDLTLYLSWSPVGAPMILGLQQRYFFCLIFFGLAGLAPATAPGPDQGLRRLGQWAGRPGQLLAQIFGVIFVTEFLLALFLTLARRYW